MMNRFNALAGFYRQRGVLLDTNLTMLLLVGEFDGDRISNFKRTNRYTKADYELLRLLLEPFQTVITTPHILTEVSNLPGNLNKPFDSRYFDILFRWINTLSEECITGAELIKRPEFLCFGITDAGIIHLAYKKYMVLTDDLPLSNELEMLGIDAFNFTNFRGFYLSE